MNPRARGGRGRRLWEQVQGEVERVASSIRVVELREGQGWEEAIGEAVRESVPLFIAAGGDGTVSALVDAIVRLRRGAALDFFTVGAVGLGSSNDFHKPFRRVVRGVPMTIDPERRGERDVARASFVAQDGGGERARHFVVSASVGITAEANAFFNAGRGLQRLLTARSTPLAIVHAALVTIARYRNIEATLAVAGETLDVAISNLSILKTPFVSGWFRFDTPVAPDDGAFAVNLSEGLSRVGAVRTLGRLARGRFLGGEGARHWRAACVAVEARSPFALELDGEVFHARSVTFGVLHDKIGVCG